MPDVSKFDYTYDEVRQMLHWELKQQGDASDETFVHIDRLCDAMTDEALIMWERAGLTSMLDLQARVEKYRNR